MMRRWFRHEVSSAAATDAVVQRAAPPVHHPVTPPMTTLLVLAADEDERCFVIDGTIADDNSVFGPRGWPITLLLRTAETPMLNASLSSMFQRWAREGVRVGFVLVGVGSHRRVALTDGQSTVYLAALGR